MISHKNPEQPDHTPPADQYISPAPRVSVQAFCATVATATTVKSASQDRRLDKAHLSVHMGGIAAAIDAYHKAPTPNVIMLETEGSNDMLAGLDELATVCDAGTRVVVIGSASDVTPYRELVRRGISDYVVGPVATIDVVRAVCNLFSSTEDVAVGRIVAVVGAKCGVGADDILIVAEPDLANMRNAKNMLNVLKAARPNDRPPLYCLNQVGMHKRPEITPREFAKALESQPIAQISAGHRTTTMFLQMAQRLTGHAVTKTSRGSLLAPIMPIIRKLRAGGGR